MQPEAKLLPELRPELRLTRGASSPAGEPTWIIHDPIQNRFIQIDQTSYHILSAWSPGISADDLMQRLAPTSDVDRTDLQKFIDFIHQNKLVIERASGGWRRFDKEKTGAKKKLSSWLIHNYLFFRVPLVRPQKFLVDTLPIANWFASKTVAAIITVAGLAGLYFTMRQWDQFISTIPELFTLEGALLLAIALAGIKAAHELGHAYTAVRYGCRVPTMGVAFMVMIPLLYTDVTDSWRLTDRSKRFRIHFAGIRVEASIAAVALLMWAFLPDGPAKGLAFTLCAVSLVSSLLINLNPLMRFDGYHLLSDMTGIDNLQDRSFELGTWKLREMLFAPDAPCPENLSSGRVRFLIGYAWLTWIYRVILFTGIALMVYHFFFKALGVILFLVEIIFFVARPIWGEVKTWWAMRQRIFRTRRTLVTAVTVLALMLLFVFPWSARVSVPSVIEMASVQPLFAKRSAEIVSVHRKAGDAVLKGDPIVTLRSPDIEQQLALAKTRLRLARVRFARRGVVGADKEDSLVIENQISALESEIRGLEVERAELVVRSPISGRLVEFNPEVHPNRWIGSRELIALIGEPEHQLAKGYISESDLWRVEAGDQGLFIPESPQRSAAPVRVSTISVGSTKYLDIPDVSSLYSGAIGSSKDEKSRLVPNTAQYLVQMAVDTKDVDMPELSIRGTVLINGRRESLLARTWRHILSVVVREAGA